MSLVLNNTFERENQHNLSYYAINKYLFKQQKAGKCNFKMTERPVSKTIQNIYKTGLKYNCYAIVYYCNTFTLEIVQCL